MSAKPKLKKKPQIFDMGGKSNGLKKTSEEKVVSKPREKVSLEDLDFGEVSKLRKNPQPSDLKMSDMHVLPEGNKKKKRSASIEMLEQFLDDSGALRDVGVGRNGSILGSPLDYIDIDPKEYIPDQFRFGGTMFNRDVINTKNGFVPVRIDPKTRKLSNAPGSKKVQIGDPRGRNLTLLIRRREVAEEREKFKAGHLLQESRKRTRGKFLDAVHEAGLDEFVEVREEKKIRRFESNG